jgi:hypothetical protein
MHAATANPALPATPRDLTTTYHSTEDISHPPPTGPPHPILSLNLLLLKPNQSNAHAILRAILRAISSGDGRRNLPTRHWHQKRGTPMAQKRLHCTSLQIPSLAKVNSAADVSRSSFRGRASASRDVGKAEGEGEGYEILTRRAILQRSDGACVEGLTLVSWQGAGLRLLFGLVAVKLERLPTPPRCGVGWAYVTAVDKVDEDMTDQTRAQHTLQGGRCKAGNASIAR